MELELIIETEETDIDDFLVWLCDKIKETSESGAFRVEALENLWYDYFLETDLGWARDDSDTPIPPSIDYIISAFFDNLTYEEIKEGYRIFTNPNLVFKNTAIGVETLARYITEGTLSLPPYSYFDDIFEFYAGELEDMFEEFYEGDAEDVEEPGESLDSEPASENDLEGDSTREAR